MATATTNRRSFLYILVRALLFTSLAAIARGQGCDSSSSSHSKFRWNNLQPFLLFTEYNPWAMSVGSDTPTFALYVDGTAIYWQGDRRSGKYLTAHLSASQIDQLVLVAHLDKVDQFSDCYSIFDGTDAPTNVLIVKTSNGYKTVEVYGPIRQSTSDITKLPADLRIAFETLFGFHTSDAKPWQPSVFEVTIWPYTYAKSTAQWPANFPNLKTPATLPTTHGYHLFIPIEQLAAYQAFVSRLKSKQAVLIDGKKWTIDARFPFPHEVFSSKQAANAAP
jgi:hypothetical protein